MWVRRTWRRGTDGAGHDAGKVVVGAGHQVEVLRGGEEYESAGRTVQGRNG